MCHTVTEKMDWQLPERVWPPGWVEAAAPLGRQGMSPLSGLHGEGLHLPAEVALVRTANGMSLQILCHGQAPRRGPPQPKDSTGAPVSRLLHSTTPHSARGHGP